MKIYCLPAPVSRTRRLFSKLTGMRLVLMLTVVASLSSLPFYVLAQNDSVPSKAKASGEYRPSPDNGVFIITQGQDGKTDCRPATVNEARAVRARSGQPELHQINHLKTDASERNAPDSATGLTIILRATAQLDANPTAKAAFIAAAAQWEAVIKDPITINIDVDYGTTFFGSAYGAGVLGQTETQLLYLPQNYTDIRQRLVNHATGSEGTLYAALPATTVPTDIGGMDTVLLATPLMRALGLLQPIADDSEQGGMIGQAPHIGFNSNFGFDFDPNNGIDGNLTDFDAVAVHEMGHALGFNSLVGDREETPSDPLFLTTWDIYRFRPGTANINNFSTAQRILSSGGTQVHFSGGPELGLSTGRPNDTSGNQGSHWRGDELGGGFIGVMDPTIARGQRYTMTSNDQNAIDAFGFTITASTPPPNDNFVNAQTISGTAGTINATNAFATKESGEPSHDPLGNAGGRSIWYRWTAPSSGQASLDTAGSNFDTLLAVYTGSSVNALVSIAKNDDAGNGVLTSALSFAAVGGTTYQIAVDGFNGDQGNVTLNFNLPGNATPTPTPTPTPPPNTVQFSSGIASATETAGATTKVDLLVTRTGTTTSAATVNYSTSNGSASDRSDYEAALGTLQFAGGETSKIITVFIVDDAFSEGPETFSVTLSSPVGCTVGAPAAVTVTINSNELADGPNPVKNGTFDNDFFVRQHYLDFLNREPDTSGLNFWKGELNACESFPLPPGFTTAQQCREIRRINVSAAFFQSIEFQQTGYLVERLYKVAYGDFTGTSTTGGSHTLFVPIVRINEFFADTQAMGKGVVIGAPGWEAQLENNKQAVIADFVTRSRFTDRYALKSSAEFVNELAANAANGGTAVLTPAERDQLIIDLNGGGSRAQVLRVIAEDPDLFAAEKNRAFVLSQYIGYLRRNPNDAPELGLDYTGHEFWLSKLIQFNGNFVQAEMVKAFLDATEYQGRFGPTN